MKLHPNKKYLPAAVAAAGLAGFGLRFGLYALGTDRRGLLAPGHPLEIALWVLTALVLGLSLWTAWKLDGSQSYEDNFAPSNSAMLGHLLAAFAIGATVLMNENPKDGLLGHLWRYVGLASVLCLIWAGLARKQGKMPNFLLHLVPGTFYALHMVNLFQDWSGNPQLMDYIFHLFTTIALAFFCIYTAYLETGLGCRRKQLAAGLLAGYLAAVSAGEGDYALLYAGSILLALGNLVTLNPKPKPPKEEEAPKDEAA